jgi:hypothetical protein
MSTIKTTAPQGLPPVYGDPHLRDKFKCYIPQRLLNVYPHLERMYSAGREKVPGYWECYLAEYKLYLNIPKQWTREL